MDEQMQSPQRTKSADVLPPPLAPPDDLLRKIKRSITNPIPFTTWKIRAAEHVLV